MEGCLVALKCVAGTKFAMLRRWDGREGRERGEEEVVRCRCCGVAKDLRQKGHQQFYHESPRTSWKRNVICLLVCVGVCVGTWCGVEWCGAIVVFVALWIVSVFMVNALAVAHTRHVTSMAVAKKRHL